MRRSVKDPEFIKRYDLLNAQLDSLKTKNDKIITFKNGRRILVDSDFNYKNIEIRNKDKYIEVSIRRLSGSHSRRSLGRFLLGLEDIDKMADHINRNTLDNRMVNLRAVTPTINALNRSTYTRVQKHVGVHESKNNLIKITLGHKGRRYHFNIPRKFFDIEDALEIYDCLSITLNGEDAYPNKPRTPERVEFIYNKYKHLVKLPPLKVGTPIALNSRNAMKSEKQLKDYSLADLNVLHEQMLKEEGYAGANRKEWYAARIADIVNEKNSRLPDDMRANVMGGVVPAVYDDGNADQRSAAVSARELAQEDKTQDTPAQSKGADVNKLKG